MPTAAPLNDGSHPEQRDGKLSSEEVECLTTCGDMAMKYTGAGALVGLTLSAVAAKRFRAPYFRGGLLVGATSVAGGLVGMLSSTQVCMQEIMKLDSKSPLKRQLVSVLCQWNPGMAQEIEKRRPSK
eukprot:CAMPEP_0114516652 /NCGR_PEP_ID=MMETSP0109-20121206/17445_1 /TAXON_ID=29199 /ORGANISM="Chlorarachnion reptans, Strain CCCM449" /LENGTH=126 /DNA_ID=CAMNT_0001697061 /DNA_START=110 /DNA_END=490 /DNA_ORIENTATION=+